MCLVLIAYQMSDQAELAVAANRDEYFRRPSSYAQYWDDAPDVFAGRDLQAKGTWLGVNTGGRFAAVTNWTDNDATAEANRSRGDLASNFLTSEISALEYVDGLNGSDYQGFNLIVYDRSQLVYYSNRTDETRTLNPGVYGITNTRLGGEWQKAIVGSQMLAEQGPEFDANSLIEMLQTDTSSAERDGRITATPERAGSPCFILGDDYGTRASTAVVFRGSTISFREQSFGPRAKPSTVVHEDIAII